MSADPKISQVEAETKDEIQEIMNEIESLKQNITEAPKAKLAAVPNPPPTNTSEIENPMENIPETSPESVVESTPESTADSLMSEIENESASEMIHELEGSHTRTADVIPIQKGKTTEGMLTMTLSGKMSLQLKYEFSDQAVTLSVLDETLKIQLADGMEFKVPFQRNSYRKAS